MSGRGRYSRGKADNRVEMIRVDTALPGASLLSVDTPDNRDSRVKYEEWFLREVDKGIATADRGKLLDHSELRKLIDERYPG